MPCKNHPFVEDRLTRCSRCAETFCPDCIVEIGGLPYCLDCKTESMRDLRSGVPLLDLDLATVGRRFVALFLDWLILLIPILILFFAVFVPIGLISLDSGGPEDLPAFLAIFGNIFLSLGVAAIYILYEGLMLSRGGQTIGKKAMSIKVVTAEGAEMTKAQAWGRVAARQVLGLVPCLGLIDYLVAFGQERTTIHDMMAKTRVVNWS
ncbi:MAG TPA: RDD family protein [Thermoanaerobaculia bacterium]|nr:RDD family protein [Thermoanaerobaculia bacterium]